ncbi:MAG: beta-ketoacyl synthase N-terminal-like domain-containing protein [Chloroflexota bacterium]
MMMDSELLEHPNAIAIIGMAGRFPGARTIDEFRHNLENGVESITTLSDEALLASGVPQSQLSDPNYVKAAALLDDYDLFDASFFQYSPREAEMMDPQHRVFLECAWEALESAGYGGASENRSVGVFAGGGWSHVQLSAVGYASQPSLNWLLWEPRAY